MVFDSFRWLFGRCAGATDDLVIWCLVVMCLDSSFPCGVDIT